MTKHKTSIVLFLLTTLSPAIAKTYTATGSGKTEQEARTDALSSLSTVFYSRVQSNTFKQEDFSQKNSRTKKKKSVANSVRVTTDIPLLGVDYSPAKNSDGLNFVNASLESGKSAPLYEAELQKLAQKLEPLFPRLSDPGKRDEALSLYDDFERFSLVANMLDAKKIPVLSLDRAEFDERVISFSGKCNSIREAAEKISSGVTKNKVFVYPALYENVQEISPFAKTLQKYIVASLGKKTSQTEASALYYFSGTVFDGEDDSNENQTVNVSYTLSSKFGRAVYSSGLVVLSIDALNGESYVPASLEFQRELLQASAVTQEGGEFFADIRINGRKDALSFSEGDRLYIEIKASEPCFVYVTGYVFSDSNKNPFAYLYPFYENGDSGKSIFIKRISNQDANRWICTNPIDGTEFLPVEVIPPFGTETLHVFATTESNLRKACELIPDFYETEDYFVVSGNPSAVVSKSRALNIKKKQENRTKTYESFVTFTTQK